MHLVVNLVSDNTRPNTEYYICLYPLTRAFIFVLSTPATKSTEMPNFFKKAFMAFEAIFWGELWHVTAGTVSDFLCLQE